jgi:copper(I)-binding protein
MFCRIARYTLLPSLLALLLLPAAATASDLEIANAWATLPEAWENSSVYFVIQSKSKKTRTLVGASGSCCDFIEIRRAVLKDGAMDSEKQDKIEIPAGGAVAFMPRGLYLNLAGLETLAVGEAVTIELEFADGGKLEFDAIGRDD